MKTLLPLPEPELSRPLKVDRIPAGGIEERIVATPTERAALAKRFSLLDLSRFEATLNVDREGKMFAVTGRLRAEVVQACVVTLEPVPEKVDVRIDVLFAPSHLIKEDHEGGLADLGEADPPEPIVGGMIDLGELAAQNLATALDPYPRKEGAALGVVEVVGKEEDSVVRKPFTVLEGLKNKTEKPED
ncbi:MAG: DUF177 domain-containing protein [Bdellovibrionales bacterium]|jgi:uncharacterized metal-binding protein YceD (DUF177 family)